MYILNKTTERIVELSDGIGSEEGQITGHQPTRKI